jgi:uncharacterized Zn finger protein
MVVVIHQGAGFFDIDFCCPACGEKGFFISTDQIVKADLFAVDCERCGRIFEYEKVFTRHRDVSAVIMPPRKKAAA